MSPLPERGDEALLKACDIISLMLAKRPDVKAHMVKKGCHVMVIGKDEETYDLPEFISAIVRTALNIGTGVPVVLAEHRKMNFHPVAEKRICWHCRRINMWVRISRFMSSLTLFIR